MPGIGRKETSRRARHSESSVTSEIGRDYEERTKAALPAFIYSVFGLHAIEPVEGFNRVFDATELAAAWSLVGTTSGGHNESYPDEGAM
jgi:hypothetical protein